MVAISMMSANLATLGLLKIKVFWNKDYDIIISVYDVTDKILSRDSNYIVDMVCSGDEVVKGFVQKNLFFWGVFLVEVQ